MSLFGVDREKVNFIELNEKIMSVLGYCKSEKVESQIIFNHTHYTYTFRF